MNKQELRAQMREMQHSTAANARFELSAPILRRLAVHPRFVRAHTVALYHALAGEVDTHDFIRYWGTRKRILLPVTCGHNLELRPYQPGMPMNTGPYGIMEPQGEAFSNYADIDLIVVPGLAFDAQGHRLGHGKGYYDRLLLTLQPYNVYKIGMCFEYQKVAQVPTEEHDIAMDEVL